MNLPSTLAAIILCAITIPAAAQDHDSTVTPGRTTSARPVFQVGLIIGATSAVSWGFTPTVGPVTEFQKIEQDIDVDRTFGARFHYQPSRRLLGFISSLSVGIAHEPRQVTYRSGVRVDPALLGFVHAGSGSDSLSPRQTAAYQVEYVGTGTLESVLIEVLAASRVGQSELSILYGVNVNYPRRWGRREVLDLVEPRATRWVVSRSYALDNNGRQLIYHDEKFDALSVSLKAGAEYAVKLSEASGVALVPWMMVDYPLASLGSDSDWHVAGVTGGLELRVPVGW